MKCTFNMVKKIKCCALGEYCLPGTLLSISARIIRNTVCN